MRLLLDQGLPRSTVVYLREAGIESAHVGEIGLAHAADERIIEYAREHEWVVATLDADFHLQMALLGAARPSVVRIRIEGLRAEKLADLLATVVKACVEDLRQGAMVSVTERRIRVRRLPLLQSKS